MRRTTRSLLTWVIREFQIREEEEKEKFEKEEIYRAEREEQKFPVLAESKQKCDGKRGNLRKFYIPVPRESGSLHPACDSAREV